jgi:DNA-binding NtrC family response regulator
MKQKPKVLIIDDNQNMRETLADILEEKGYDVVTAKTGQEALGATEKSFFNIHLIDINLPDKIGIELLRSFKNAYPVRKNIMITASTSLKYAVDAVNLGADAYILKPIDLIKLDQIMKECLRQQQPTLEAMNKRLVGFMTNSSEKQLTTKDVPQ